MGESVSRLPQVRKIQEVKNFQAAAAERQEISVRTLGGIRMTHHTVTYRGRKISVTQSWEFPGFWVASMLMPNGEMYSFFARSALVAFCGLRDNYRETQNGNWKT